MVSNSMWGCALAPVGGGLIMSDEDINATEIVKAIFEVDSEDEEDRKNLE